MSWFSVADLGLVLLCGWFAASPVVVPRFTENPTVVVAVVLAVGLALLFGFDAIAPRSGPYVMVMTVLLIVASLVALAGSEIVFRRRHGYWRLLGSPQS